MKLTRAERRGLPIVGVTVLIGIFSIGPVRAGDVGASGVTGSSQNAGLTTEREGAPNAAGAGMRVHIDPKTGQFTAAPQAQPRGGAAGLAAPDEEQLDAGVAPITTTAGRSRAGGVIVHLRGHFRSALIPRVDASGKVTADCVQKEVGQ